MSEDYQPGEGYVTDEAIQSRRPWYAQAFEVIETAVLTVALVCSVLVVLFTVLWAIFAVATLGSSINGSRELSSEFWSNLGVLLGVAALPWVYAYLRNFGLLNRWLREMPLDDKGNA
ncbi:hypothetical protein [Erythrobacter sp. EC-HK427]|uniref:hypothetical protein n=1 Tax=Erythrobacter sp. EC-HK427 TaxID=2038396 RepID=UPI0012525E5C|nr:hypothetical protein [Erythrobacter sp. EC-HK427]VVS96421.1 hypothetical protein ERY430_30058 [Erythrobacter sp. EC-HK427]